jgi:L,D-peptidoglycan transpeptidase YkuD (ErfK/YbiS/YcfS/YnhG family)
MFDRISTSRQLVMVIADSWTGIPARLCCFERTTTGWTRQMRPFPVVVGNRGLAWDAEQEKLAAEGPRKCEGDGKAPAGAFRLLYAMGHAATPPDSVVFPYEQIHQDMHCVDDGASADYNRIVRASTPSEKRWQSSEHLSTMSREYRWLIVIDHNKQSPKPGAGSCIFLHIWRSPDKGTAGCTAMAERDLLALLGWLRSEKNPLLVQLPRAEYGKVWKSWGLPPPEQLYAP